MVLLLLRMERFTDCFLVEDGSRSSVGTLAEESLKKLDFGLERSESFYGVYF